VTDAGEDRGLYQVVMNGQGQYSIWPADRDPPPGWSRVGPVAERRECLAFVERIWTDTTPRGIRRAGDAGA